jgi:hypothetical protein
LQKSGVKGAQGMRDKNKEKRKSDKGSIKQKEMTITLELSGVKEDDT